MEKPLETLIFNGTGVNYSWHFPQLSRMDTKNLPGCEKVFLVSGGVTAYSVFFARDLGLLTWTREDFLNWNRHVARVYGNGLVSGSWRLFRIVTGFKTPVLTEEMYRRTYEVGVRPDFFKVQLGDLPEKVFVALHNLDTGEIELAHRNSKHASLPAYKVFFAATAIPKVFPVMTLNGTRYGDPIFAKGFLKWIKRIERDAKRFKNYNLIKNDTFPNGEYICLSSVKNPRSIVNRETYRFLLGRHIESYPENVRKAVSFP